MNKRYKFRDWPKRIRIPDAVYFITFYTKHRYPFFKEPVLCDLFVKNLKICKQMKKFLLFGWVILYEHIHLLMMLDGQSDISDIMHYLKRHTSRNINIILGHTSPPVSQDGYPDVEDRIRSTSDISTQTSHIIPGGDCHPHLQKDSGVRPSPVRQYTPPVSQDGYPDVSGANKSIIEFIYPSADIIKGMPRFKWQQSFYDRYMRDDNEFDNTLDYIAYNPDKHGLPENWPYVFTNEKFENLTDNIL